MKPKFSLFKRFSLTGCLALSFSLFNCTPYSQPINNLPPESQTKVDSHNQTSNNQTSLDNNTVGEDQNTTTISDSNVDSVHIGDNTTNINITAPAASEEKINNPPIISDLIVNPRQNVGPDDVITFDAEANDADGEALKYTWSATKGILSSNQGQLISWYPKTTKGEPLPAGVASITLKVSDSKGLSDTTSVNIIIESDGTSYLEALPDFDDAFAGDEMAPPTMTEEESVE